MRVYVFSNQNQRNFWGRHAMTLNYNLKRVIFLSSSTFLFVSRHRRKIIKIWQNSNLRSKNELWIIHKKRWVLLWGLSCIPKTRTKSKISQTYSEMLFTTGNFKLVFFIFSALPVLHSSPRKRLLFDYKSVLVLLKSWPKSIFKGNIFFTQQNMFLLCNIMK